MHCFETLHDYQTFRKSLPPNHSVGFVPTMGALHPGHLALIQRAKSVCDTVVVSIFVNPTQFAPHEDYQRYPRPREQDLALCEQAGVTAVFYPSVGEMYPERDPDSGEGTTQVIPPPSLTQEFCGKVRPGHFTGVATVVLKLFSIIQPHVAVFGEKDAQQLAVIERMVDDLNLPVQIIAAPTVRETSGEASGLALSSRNQYLQPHEKPIALTLYKTLNAIETQWQAQCPAADTLNTALQQTLATLTPEERALFQLEYLAAVDPKTLAPVEHLVQGTRILIAAKVGSVRLIDNRQI